MNNILKETIEEALKDVHVGTYTKYDFTKIVFLLEKKISEKIISHDIDYYTEILKQTMRD